MSNTSDNEAQIAITDVDALSALELAHVAKTLIDDALSKSGEQATHTLYAQSLTHINNAIALLEHAIEYCHRQNAAGDSSLVSLDEFQDLEGKVKVFARGVVDFAISNQGSFSR